MTQAILSLHVRFPGLETCIEKRCEQDDEFRALCDDLVDAETVLRNLERSACSPERLIEYRSLVASLSSEIASAMGSGQVIPFRRSTGG